METVYFTIHNNLQSVRGSFYNKSKSVIMWHETSFCSFPTPLCLLHLHPSIFSWDLSGQVQYLKNYQSDALYPGMSLGDLRVADKLIVCCTPWFVPHIRCGNVTRRHMPNVIEKSLVLISFNSLLLQLYIIFSMILRGEMYRGGQMSMLRVSLVETGLGR